MVTMCGKPNGKRNVLENKVSYGDKTMLLTQCAPCPYSDIYNNQIGSQTRPKEKPGPHNAWFICDVWGPNSLDQSAEAPKRLIWSTLQDDFCTEVQRSSLAVWEAHNGATLFLFPFPDLKLLAQNMTNFRYRTILIYRTAKGNQTANNFCQRNLGLLPFSRTPLCQLLGA